MVKGIPYWGKETFNEIRQLNQLTEVKEKEIKESSIYDLFYSLANKNCVVRLKENDTYFYSYIRDVCFNYRDKVILIPYWSYLETEKKLNINNEKVHLDILENGNISIKHSFKLMYEIIDNRPTKERKEYLEIYDTESKELYKVRLTGLPYVLDKEFSLEDLHDRYINSAYYLIDSSDFSFENRYHMIEKENGYNLEYKARTQCCLKHFVSGIGYYDLLNYKDFRHYKYHDLINLIPRHLEDRRGYWERRYLFEGYLYCIFAEGLEPKEVDYKDIFKRLGVTKRYLKYEKNELSLFLKYYYKDSVTMKKKSYERHIKL